jgi:hypothetical protein
MIEDSRISELAKLARPFFEKKRNDLKNVEMGF